MFCEILLPRDEHRDHHVKCTACGADYETGAVPIMASSVGNKNEALEDTGERGVRGAGAGGGQEVVGMESTRRMQDMWGMEGEHREQGACRTLAKCTRRMQDSSEVQ